MPKIICLSVVGGWQSAVVIGDAVHKFGPVFNSCIDLWKWQGAQQ